jgi:hypothetical protein
MAVDVVTGPLVTFAIYSRTKPRQLLIMAFVLVGSIQLTALGYGLWTVFVARPVHVVFKYSRLSVVHAVDIQPQLLAKASPQLHFAGDWPHHPCAEALQGCAGAA